MATDVTKFKYSSTSVGRYLGKISVKTTRWGGIGPARVTLGCWQAVGPAREDFTKEIFPEVGEYLKQSDGRLQSSGSIVVISLFMVGRSKERTKPTVMLVSDDKAARQRAVAVIKQSGIMAKHDAFALSDASRAAEFAMIQLLAGHESSHSAVTLQHCPNDVPLAPIHISSRTSPARQTLRGAQLSFIPGSVASSTHTATAGEYVRYNNTYYLLTVQHFLTSDMAKNPIAMPEANLLGVDSDDGDCEIFGFDDFGPDATDFDEDQLLEITSRGSQTPESLASNAASDDDSIATIECTTSEPEGFESPVITDSVSYQDPTEESAGALVEIGVVRAQSRELDYSAIQLEEAYWPNDEEAKSAIDLDSELRSHIESSPRDATVVLQTASSGTLLGRMSGTPVLVLLPASTSFQEVYAVSIHGNLSLGDCGGSVRDFETGKLFGHLVAGSQITGIALIMPAHAVLKDLSERLGSRQFPSASTGSNISSGMSNPLDHLCRPAENLNRTGLESPWISDPKGFATPPLNAAYHPVADQQRSKLADGNATLSRDTGFVEEEFNSNSSNHTNRQNITIDSSEGLVSSLMRGNANIVSPVVTTYTTATTDKGLVTASEIKGVRISDIRKVRLTPDEAREELSDYFIYRFEPAKGAREYDDGDELDRNPNWESVFSMEVRGVSKKEVARQVRELNQRTRSFAYKKATLNGAQQRQIDKILEELQAQDDVFYQTNLVQIGRQLGIKPKSKSDKRRRRNVNSGHSTDARELFRDRNKREKLLPFKGKRKEIKVQEQISLTAYYKRGPKPELDALAMYHQREALWRHAMHPQPPQPPAIMHVPEGGYHHVLEAGRPGEGGGGGSGRVHKGGRGAPAATIVQPNERRVCRKLSRSPPGSPTSIFSNSDRSFMSDTFSVTDGMSTITPNSDNSSQGSRRGSFHRHRPRMENLYLVGGPMHFGPRGVKDSRRGREQADDSLDVGLLVSPPRFIRTSPDLLNVHGYRIHNLSPARRRQLPQLMDPIPVDIEQIRRGAYEAGRADEKADVERIVDRIARASVSAAHPPPQSQPPLILHHRPSIRLVQPGDVSHDEATLERIERLDLLDPALEEARHTLRRRPPSFPPRRELGSGEEIVWHEDRPPRRPLDAALEYMRRTEALEVDIPFMDKPFTPMPEAGGNGRVDAYSHRWHADFDDLKFD